MYMYMSTVLAIKGICAPPFYFILGTQVVVRLGHLLLKKPKLFHESYATLLVDF